MEVRRIRVDLPTNVLRLNLGLQCQLRRAHLRVELRNHAESLLVCGAVFARPRSSLLRSTQRRLNLLLLFRMR